MQGVTFIVFHTSHCNIRLFIPTDSLCGIVSGTHSPYRDIAVCRQTLFLVFAGCLRQGFFFLFGTQELLKVTQITEVGAQVSHRCQEWEGPRTEHVYGILERKKKLAFPPSLPSPLSFLLLSLSLSLPPALPHPQTISAPQPLFIIQQLAHLCPRDPPP